MSIQDKCAAKVHKAVGKSFTREEINEIVGEVFNVARRDKDLGGSIARKFKLAARELTEADTLAAKQGRLERAINIRAAAQLDGQLAALRDGGLSRPDAIDAKTVGRIDAKEHVGFSDDAQIKSRQRRWRGGFMADLDEARLLAHWGRGDPVAQRNLFVELYRLQGKDYPPSGDANAVAIAQIVTRWQELGRVTQNNAGAAIPKRKGYIVGQTHDQVAIAKTDGAWIDEVAPLLDEETFEGVTDRRKFLREVYVNLATGNHMRPPGDAGAGSGFKGPSNLAKRLAAGRVLIFKSPDAAFQYNAKFGVGTIYDGVVRGLDNAARNSVLLENWGTNPQAMFDRVVEKEIAAAKAEGNLKDVARLETAFTKTSGLVPGLRANFESMTGAADIPGNPTVARWMQAARNLTAMTKLGGMVLSQFSDLGARAAVLRHNGVNYLEGVGDGFASLARLRGGPEFRRQMWRMGVGHDGIAGYLLSRYSAADDVPGGLTRAMGTFFKWNGSAIVQDSLESGLGAKLAGNIFDKRILAFEQLPPRLQNNFRRYGIDARGWDTIRASEPTQIDGADYIFAEAVADPELRNRLEVYYVDQSREGMTMGGAAEKAWITQFGPAGSLPGEVARFALQFKNFSMTYMRRHLMREMGRDGFDGAGAATLFAWMTALGYISMAAKDLAKGREPRDPANPETWGAAFMQGGGFGIYGDYLLGEYSRFGNTLGETIAGPAVGTVSDWATIFARIAVGVKDEATGEGAKWGKIGAQAVKTAVNSAPYSNLFYTRAALDYLILYQLQEAMDPGSLRRMEQRIKKENNQEFIVSPSRAVPRGGGSRILEGVR